jgi:uncharacterized protein YllA (UPF0747 family)
MKGAFSIAEAEMPMIIPRHSATFLDAEGFKPFRRKHRDSDIFSFVYPNGNLQERVISALYFVNICGISAFNSLLGELSCHSPHLHYSVNLS